MVVIGYYTVNTPYENEAIDFRENLESYGIEYKLYPVEAKGSWVLNCGIKPTVILNALEEFKDNILYTDVDSRFVRQPPFEDIEKDIPGFCLSTPWHVEELLSGTLYFPNNDLSRNILNHWIEVQEKYPGNWDQQNLQAIVHNYDYFRLHEDWVKIFDNEKMNSLDPIIKHYQASRRYKGKV